MFARLFSNESQDTARGPDRWLTPGRFTLLLVALVLVDFGAMALGWQSLFFRDFGYFGYPLAHYHRECFWRGELPLWNPLNCNGLPFLAQWNTLTLYPPSLIYLLLPLPWSLNLFSLAHLVLGGVGMFVLARRWTGGALGAGVAGLAFAFNGLTINSLLWPNNIAALGWMPWVIWLAERAWREKGLRPLAVAALAGALQMLSGAPEIILFTWLLLGAMMAGQSIWNGVAWQWNWRVPARFAAMVLLVGGLSAAQLLPFLELLHHSERSSAFADTLVWPMPQWGWANFLVPLFRCYRSGVGVYFQSGQEWTSSYYLGGSVFVLALLAVWRTRQRRVWLLGGVMVLALILALGEAGHLYPLVRKIFPLAGFVRFTIKFVLLVVFCAPLLAAFTIQRQLNGTEGERASGRKSLAIVLVACLLAIGAIIWSSYHLPLRGENYSASWLHGASRAALFAGILGILWWCSRAGNRSAVKMAGITLPLLIWIDLRTHAPNPAPGIKPDVLAPALVKEQWRREGLAAAPSPGTFRAFTPQRAYDALLQGMISDPSQDYLCHRLALFPNCNLLEDIPLVDGFYSLYLKHQRDAWSLLYFAPTNNAMTPWLDFLGISRITSTTNIFDWELRPDPMPFASIGQDPVFADADATWSALASPAFDPRRTVYLPPDAKASIANITSTDARIVSQTFAAHRQEFEVEAANPTLLVLSQSWYPEWRAKVDGKPAPICRANGAFQAVAIPAGRHRVNFVYEDRVFQAGAWLSLFSLILCGGLLARPRAAARPAGTASIESDALAA